MFVIYDCYCYFIVILLLLLLLFLLLLLLLLKSLKGNNFTRVSDFVLLNKLTGKNLNFKLSSRKQKMKNFVLS